MRRQMMMREMMARRGAGNRPGGAPPAMELADGNFYVVVGRTVKLLDAETLEEAASTEIPLPEAEAARLERTRANILKRFDGDGDGFVTAEEAPRPDLIGRLDKDGDGKLSAEELGAMGGARPPGPATLMIEGESIYVFQDGSLYRFDAADLELKAQAVLVEPPERPFPDRERMDRMRRDRGGERDERRRGRGREGREGRGREDDEPEAPEDPIRF